MEIISLSVCYTLSFICDYVMISPHVLSNHLLVVGPFCSPGDIGEPPEVPDATSSPLL